MTVLRDNQIPHYGITIDLFPDSPAQKIVPFLGAGVSISARENHEATPPASEQDPRIAMAMECLRKPGQEFPDAAGNPRATFEADTLLYAETALEMAPVIQQIRAARDSTPDVDVLQILKEARYPPSAGELVDLLMQNASFVSFEEVLTRISQRLGRPVDARSQDAMLALLRLIAQLVGASAAPLSSISAYFEIVSRRQTLLDRLSDILQNKIDPTPTHQLIATAASWHITPRKRKDGSSIPEGAGNFLIMTTNYDCLMESALRVPYVVLSMSMTDFRIRSRFGNMEPDLMKAFHAANPARPASRFTLERPTLNETTSAEVVEAAAALRMAIVYKVHGCIEEWKDAPPDYPRQDTIIISDNDYVSNISRLSHNDGVIPVCVSDILKGSQKPYFLFLGYSLTDWNIRGMLRAIRDKRGGEGDETDFGDYTVVRKFNTLDETFFTQNKIRIIHEDLKNFAPAVENKRRVRYGS